MDDDRQKFKDEIRVKNKLSTHSKGQKWCISCGTMLFRHRYPRTTNYEKKGVYYVCPFCRKGAISKEEVDGW